MPFTVVKLENKPILVAHVSGELTGDVHFALAMKAAELADNVNGKIYLVLDLTHARLDLLNMVEVLAQMTSGWPGTPSDPRIISMLVISGGNGALAVAHLIRRWDGWRKVFVFNSMAQALACARGPIIVESEEAMTLIG